MGDQGLSFDLSAGQGRLLFLYSYFSHHLPWWLQCFAMTSWQFLVLFTSKSIPRFVLSQCWHWYFLSQQDGNIAGMVFHPLSSLSSGSCYRHANSRSSWWHGRQWFSTCKYCWRWGEWSGKEGCSAVRQCCTFVVVYMQCQRCPDSRQILFHGVLNPEPWKEQLVLWRDTTRHGPVSAFITNLTVLTVSLKTPCHWNQGIARKSPICSLNLL